MLGGEREGELELEELSLFRKGELNHVPRVRMVGASSGRVSGAIPVDVPRMSLEHPAVR